MVHQTSLHALADDLFLLASDGLTEVMNESDILSHLWENDRPLRAIGKDLIEAVNALGVKDNVTVCLLRTDNNP